MNFKNNNVRANFSVQKNLLMKNLSEVNDIRCEVLKYEQKLNRERLKCRALEETLLKPTNVHRWRILKVIYNSVLRAQCKCHLLIDVVRIQPRIVVIRRH